jgi:hypothetical protein
MSKTYRVNTLNTVKCAWDTTCHSLPYETIEFSDGKVVALCPTHIATMKKSLEVSGYTEGPVRSPQAYDSQMVNDVVTVVKNQQSVYPEAYTGTRDARAEFIMKLFCINNTLMATDIVDRLMLIQKLTKNQSQSGSNDCA